MLEVSGKDAYNNIKEKFKEIYFFDENTYDSKLRIGEINTNNSENNFFINNDTFINYKNYNGKELKEDFNILFYPPFNYKKEEKILLNRSCGFKQINDNIIFLQNLFQYTSGIISTYLTEWDLSSFFQNFEDLKNKKIIDIEEDYDINLTNTIDKKFLPKEGVYSNIKDINCLGVLNYASSECGSTDSTIWKIESHPFSKNYIYNTLSLDECFKISDEGLDFWIEKYGNSPSEIIKFQDYEGAVLSGYQNWDFPFYKVLYSNNDNRLSKLDNIDIEVSLKNCKKNSYLNKIYNINEGNNGKLETKKDKDSKEISTGAGIPQNNPTLFGGPHGRYLNPETIQGFFETKNIFYQNLGKISGNFSILSNNNIPFLDGDKENNPKTGYFPSTSIYPNNNFFNGPESQASLSSVSEKHNLGDQSFSLGLSRLRNGIMTLKEKKIYIKVKKTKIVELGFAAGKYIKPSKDKEGRILTYDDLKNPPYRKSITHSYTIGILDKPKFLSKNLKKNGFHDWSKPENISVVLKWKKDGWIFKPYYEVTEKRYKAYQLASYYDKEYSLYRRHLLHSEPNLNWWIVKSSFKEASKDDMSTKSPIKRNINNLIKYIENNEPIYKKEEFLKTTFELHCSDNGSEYTPLDVDISNEKYLKGVKYSHSILVNLNAQERRVLKYLIDDNEASSYDNKKAGTVGKTTIGEEGRIIFATRDNNGNIKDLFRCPVVHELIPVIYTVKKQVTEASNRKKDYFTELQGWRDILSVKLDRCDFLATDINSGALEINNDSTIESINLKDLSNFNCNNMAKEDIASFIKEGNKEFDILEYNAEAGINLSKKTKSAIEGKGLFGSIPGLSYEGENIGGDIISDKTCVKDANKYSKPLNTLNFPLWKATGYSLEPRKEIHVGVLGRSPKIKVQYYDEPPTYKSLLESEFNKGSFTFKGRSKKWLDSLAVITELTDDQREYAAMALYMSEKRSVLMNKNKDLLFVCFQNSYNNMSNYTVLKISINKNYIVGKRDEFVKNINISFNGKITKKYLSYFSTVNERKVFYKEFTELYSGGKSPVPIDFNVDTNQKYSMIIGCLGPSPKYYDRVDSCYKNYIDSNYMKKDVNNSNNKWKEAYDSSTSKVSMSQEHEDLVLFALKMAENRLDLKKFKDTFINLYFIYFNNFNGISISSDKGFSLLKVGLTIKVTDNLNELNYASMMNAEEDKLFSEDIFNIFDDNFNNENELKLILQNISNGLNTLSSDSLEYKLFFGLVEKELFKFNISDNEKNPENFLINFYDKNLSNLIDKYVIIEEDDIEIESGFPIYKEIIDNEKPKNWSQTILNMCLRSSCYYKNNDNSISANWSYLYNYNILLYNILSKQIAYLKYCKDYFNMKDKDKFIVSFDFIKSLILGNDKSKGFISKKCLKYSDTLSSDYDKNNVGYNYWVETALKYFDNSSEDNYKNHLTLIEYFSFIIDKLEINLENLKTLKMEKDKIAFFDIKKFLNICKDLKDISSGKEFFYINNFMAAYLHILYEIRRYYINLRFNKQNGTIWSTKLISEVEDQILGATTNIDSLKDIKINSFSESSDNFNVAFYSTENNKITKLYIPVTYSSKENGENIKKVIPWEYVKIKNNFKRYSSELELEKNEKNRDGWVIKVSNREKFASIPKDGLYKLISKEYIENKKYKRDYDERFNKDLEKGFFKYIKWSEMGSNNILFNLKTSINIKILEDLAKNGIKDPFLLNCASKVAEDFWEIDLGSEGPNKDFYINDLKIKLVDDKGNEFNDNLISFALGGFANSESEVSEHRVSPPITTFF